MKNDYPSIDNENAPEYAEKINLLFKKNNVNWNALSLSPTKQVLVQPRDSYCSLPNVARIRVHVKEGVMYLDINAYPRIKNSDSRYALEDKGYNYYERDNSTSLCLFIKPLENLEAITEEVKEIEPILLQK